MHPPACQGAPLLDTRLVITLTGAPTAVVLTAFIVAFRHGTRTLRFTIAWHAEELAPQPGASNWSHCGTTDVNRMYHNKFAGPTGLEQMLSYTTDDATRAALHDETVAWQAPIMASTMPTFLKFKLINSAYTMFTNTLLNKAGHFSAMEGGMGGLAGTMDQRIAAHSFYFKFFPATDALELAQFGAAQITSCQDIQNWPNCRELTNAQAGAITHFDANIYAAITGSDEASVVTANSEYEDNTYGWIYQLAKAFTTTGNLTAVLAQKDAIPRAIAHAASLIAPAASGGGKYAIPGPASNTYDDFWELPIDVYVASMFPMVMHSGAILATAIGNASLAAECEERATRAGEDFFAALYNGYFFAYGCQLNGTGRRDDIIFGGMLAGQMLSRHAGWGDLPAVSWAAIVSSVRAQLARQVGVTYDFYPPKVFNLSSASSALDPRSGNPASTWQFYLESYTAATAIQAGFVDDGLAIAEHIGLVNLRLGLNWAQSLWAPALLTYVTAPVTWFLPDVLAGAALDVRTHTLFLAPILKPADQSVELPLFFPAFWASVRVRRSAGGGSGGTITLSITKAFGKPVVVTQVVSQPVGRSTGDGATVGLAAPFACSAGAVLDLSDHWASIVGASIIRPSVLPGTSPGFGSVPR